MELRDYLQILRSSWILILTVTFAGIVASMAASFAQTPIYTSSTSVFVAIPSTGSNSADLNAGTTYVQNQITSFTLVATTDKVLQPVIDDLGLATTVGQLAGQVTATSQPGSVIIQIAVSDRSPARAAAIANDVARSLISSVEELSKPVDGASPIKISLLSPALQASSATSPNYRTNVLLGFLIGFVIGVGIAILRRVLDIRVHGSREVAELTDAPVLGAIRFDEEARDRPLVVQVSPQSPRAESFRQLRTNLQFVEVTDEGRTFLLTSSMPSEGKSSTSVNLAITLAEAGMRVLLIDGDLRRPKVAEYMGIEGAVGLTDHLIGRANLDDVVQPWGDGNLAILPAGQVPPNPSELLSSKAMINLLKKLDKSYDTVIIDAPPLLPVTDAAILSKLVSGGAMLVVGSGKISKHQLEAAIRSLDTAGGRLVGVIMNFLPSKGVDAYGYYGYAPIEETVAARKRFGKRASEGAN